MNDTKNGVDAPLTTGTDWATTTEAQCGAIDKLEAEAKRDAECIGNVDPLTHAMHLLGFADWPDVCRLARGGHRVAVEILARRVERIGAPS